MPLEPPQLRAAAALCVASSETERVHDERYRLARAGLLFAQMAEQMERDGPLEQFVIRRCDYALYLVRNDRVRNKVEMLLREPSGETPSEKEALTISGCCAQQNNNEI